MFDALLAPPAAPVWQVGALCRAVAETLQHQFNPVTVRGELTGFSRAASGHCYFSLKDASGQLRCAMFKRAASTLAFLPRDGEVVEVVARLGLYEPRGDLQLVVERMTRAGVGNWYEQFLQLKAKLQAQGLFDAARKRPLPPMPRAIGLVTSLGAAALHDVVSVLQRRVPHIAVVLAPASVQGANAPAEIIAALLKLYQLAEVNQGLKPDLKLKNGNPPSPPVDVILLVRGGGAMEDLWAFNDEALALTISQSPVPLVSGIGHETDFTLADFCADLRAPTPTAAAELVAQPQEVWLNALAHTQARLQEALLHQLDRQNQRLDAATQRLGRPSGRLSGQALRLLACEQQLGAGLRQALAQRQQHLGHLGAQLAPALNRGWQQHNQRLLRAGLRLDLLDPQLVLQRGYAWLSDADGQTVSSCRQTTPGQPLRATLADGTVDLTVNHP